jgi:hypothetical protein
MAAGGATMLVRPATQGERDELGLRTGGALRVETVPAALSADLRVGDMLVFAGGQALTDAASMLAAVEAAAGRPLEILYYRSGVPGTAQLVMSPSMLGITPAVAPPLGPRPPALVTDTTAPTIEVTGKPPESERGFDPPIYSDAERGVRLYAPPGLSLRASRNPHFQDLPGVLYEFQDDVFGLHGALLGHPGGQPGEQELAEREQALLDVPGMASMTLVQVQTLPYEPGTWVLRESRAVQFGTTFVDVHVHVLTPQRSFQLILSSNARGDGEELRAAMSEVIVGLQVGEAPQTEADNPEGNPLLRLEAATTAMLEDLGLRTGGALVISSVPASLDPGLQRGDVLVFADGRPLDDLAALRTVVTSAAGKPIELVFYRGQAPGSIRIELPANALPNQLGP